MQQYKIKLKLNHKLLKSNLLYFFGIPLDIQLKVLNHTVSENGFDPD
jgi:hypothetical protein